MNLHAIISIAGDTLACLANLIRRIGYERGKVFFLARDGYLPWKLMPDAGSYVAVSRQALRVPLLTRDAVRAVEWTIDRVTVNTVASVLARWKIDPHVVASLLERHGLGNCGWYRPLQRAERRRFCELLKSPEFVEIARHELRDELSIAMQYLECQGLLGPEGGVIVDVGWNGSCHKHLQEFRQLAGVPEHSLGGVYVGLQQRRGFASQTLLHALWEPVGLGASLFSLDSFYPLVEIFFTANHGGVIGYERTDELARPVFASHDESGEISRWGLGKFQNAMLEHAGNRLADSSCDWDALLVQTMENLARLIVSPTRDEAEFLGSWPVCVDQTHGESHSLAPVMDVNDMWLYFFKRLPQPVLWRSGVRAQLEGAERAVFQAASYGDNLLVKCKSYAFRVRNGK